MWIGPLLSILLTLIARKPLQFLGDVYRIFICLLLRFTGPYCVQFTIEPSLL